MGPGLRRDDQRLDFEPAMNQKIKTFLMFEGRCEEAMNFYVSLFRDAAVTGISRYGPGEAGAEGR
jgi:predicted 3-demethylubiquinone-9 3-methyltransferase (glyoxalase superfamily)